MFKKKIVVKLEDIKKKPVVTYPFSFRLSKGEHDFIMDNEISVRKLVQKTLKQLGYKA